MGNGCCGFESAGRCKKPATCVGRAVLAVSIIGIIFALVSESAHIWYPVHTYEECCEEGYEEVCDEEGLKPGECVDNHITLWMITVGCLQSGQDYGALYMLGIGLVLAALSHLIATTGFSLPVCCCTSAKGYKCAATVLGVAIGIYTCSFIMSVAFHGVIASEIENWDMSEEDRDRVHAFVWATMGIVYAIILVPYLLGIADCRLLCKGRADWPEEGRAAASQEMPIVSEAVAVTVDDANPFAPAAAKL